MAIKDIGKFTINESKNETSLVHYPVGYVQEVVKFIKEYKIDVVSIWKYADIEFIKQCPSLRGISISGVPEKFEHIYCLKGLEFIEVITENELGIDFNKFPNLKEAHFARAPKDASLFDCKNLEKLTLKYFKGTDLRVLHNLKKLRYLEFGFSSIKSILGVEVFRDLEILDFYNLRNVNDISPLEGTTKISRLLFENCGKVNDIATLKYLVNLAYLKIDNCKEILSLGPIRNLKKLKGVDFRRNTNIVDGDLTPLLGKGKVNFGPRKHYSHTNEAIDKINGIQRNENVI